MRGVIALLLVLSARVFAADMSYSKEARQAKILNALSAFREAKVQEVANLERYLSSIARGSCRANDDGLLAQCLEEHAKKNCSSAAGRSRARCVALSDVIVVNQVNEKQFISRDERFQLLQKSGVSTFNTAYSKIMMRKYALVTTEFLLSQPACDGKDETVCLAKSIDDYCLQHADVRNLPWQGCVSSIVWFLGVSS